MRLGLVLGFQALQLWMISATVFAQQAAPLPELPPPPPAAEPAPGQPPPAAAPTDAACTPPCRSGFLCQSGVCISACNPPCPADQQCTAQGECAYAYPYGQPPPGYPGATPLPPPPPAVIYPAAPPPPPPPGSFEHDGFLLRATVGLGFGAVEQALDVEESNYFDTTYSGLMLALAIDGGYAVVKNFTLQLRFGFALLPEPRLSTEGFDETTNANFSIGNVLLAPGVTYYFMPINLYLSGALGLTWFTFDRDYDNSGDIIDDASDATDVGVGLNVDVGKEWWVARQWGIGVAGRFHFAAASGDLASGRYDWSLLAFTLMFSATLQ
jgi:hypothetical protein